MRLRILLALCLIPAFSSFASADTVWDEGVSGDLSGLFGAPDPIAFSLGSNTIIGSIGENGNSGATDDSDADYFTFSIDAGQQLSAITIDSFTFTGADPGVSFLAYVADTSFAGQNNPDIDGAAFFAAGFGDILIQLPGPLGPGNYSIWLQETMPSVVDYQFTFQVTGFTLGDANGDGVFNNADIASFVLALTNSAAYQAMFPNVDPDVVLDMNGDGVFKNGDIASFVAALTGGGKK